MWTILSWVVLITAAFPVHLAAQELNETLGQVAEPYAQEYARPLANAAGADLNSGLYHTARVGTDRFSFDLYIGVRGSGTLLRPPDQSFDLTYRDTTELTYTIGSASRTVDIPATFTTEEAPTIFGTRPAGASTVTVDHDTTVSYLGVLLPASFDTTFVVETVGGLAQTDIAPLAVPHLQLGTVFGTDLTVRWSPPIEIRDVGTAQLKGIGIRHSLSQYIPGLPIDVAVQAAWQELDGRGENEDEHVVVTTQALNLQISKRSSFITVFGGFQMEESTVDIGYVVLVDEGKATPNNDAAYTPIEVSLDGATRLRGTVGITLHLGPLQTNIDVSRGHRTIVTAGMGLAF